MYLSAHCNHPLNPNPMIHYLLSLLTHHILSPFLLISCFLILLILVQGTKTSLPPSHGFNVVVTFGPFRLTSYLLVLYTLFYFIPILGALVCFFMLHWYFKSPFLLSTRVLSIWLPLANMFTALSLGLFLYISLFFSFIGFILTTLLFISILLLLSIWF